MNAHEEGPSLLRQTLLRVAPLPESELEYLQRHAEPRSYPAGTRSSRRVKRLRAAGSSLPVFCASFT